MCAGPPGVRPGCHPLRQACSALARLKNQVGNAFSDDCCGQSRRGARKLREYRSVSDAKAPHAMHPTPLENMIRPGDLRVLGGSGCVRVFV